jgi:uncharacterized protein (DUF362 family)
MPDALTPVVAVARVEPQYAAFSPYDPDTCYPEYPYGQARVAAEPNHGYRAVRACLQQLELDRVRLNTAQWNPLGEIVRPGDTVVLKPNFVIDRHYGGGELYAIVTHPSIIRAVADYCQIALGGRGRLILADAPVDDCDFDRLSVTMGLAGIQEFYRARKGLPLEVYDLRHFVSPAGERMYVSHRQSLPGDPAGDVVVDLGRDSALFGKPGPFYGADPDTRETCANHHNGVHRYCVSKTVLSSDVLISLPKMKVHKKVGATLNCKGLVGTNTNKNYLVHYTIGAPSQGGDQTADVTEMADRAILSARRLIRRLFFGSHHPLLERIHHDLFHSAPYHVIRRFLCNAGLRAGDVVSRTDGGDWYGNDSCWRMVADLARIVHFADADGVLHSTPQRRIISFVDGIVGGEGNGPLLPDPKPAGIVVGGVHPLAVDLVCCALMGIDWRKLALYRFLSALPPPLGVSEPAGIRIVTSEPELTFCLRRPGPHLAFRLHPNWVGHIEAET